ncbi:MAG: phosphoglucosamine mutase [Desulfovibrionaceae bacterium]|nr:phosphoglucosamine mutase [Desulfovibrionaceae bacterium]
MTKKLFGTDGIRGPVNKYPMFSDLALRLGLAAGTYFRTSDDRRHRVVIGKDTRLSGYIFENALTAGLCAAGMDVFLVGPLPTPAIAFLTTDMRADLGIVISASHNPFQDNGIKLFSRDGFKLDDAAEHAIEQMILDENIQWDYPAPDKVGKAFRIDDSQGRYIVYLKYSFPAHLDLSGMKVVLDCANGANYHVGPVVLEELGAKVIRIGCEPNGLNINLQCGSLFPEMAAAKVRECGADIGIALDGDADRIILVDENGEVLDGDQIMAICAEDMIRQGRLSHNTLVATVMSNMALEVFMKERNGVLLRTPVGDRNVVEAMRNAGAALGGEQSGHIIFMDYGTTGDGLLAALQVMKIMRERNQPLSELAGLLTPYPQKLINLQVANKVPFENCPLITAAVRDAESELGECGRVLLRYSGTEAKARVMVEGENKSMVNRLAAQIAEAVKEELG